MKKCFLVIIMLMAFFLYHGIVIADSCSTEEQLKLRNIAASTTITYDYVQYDQSSGFNVIMSGFTPEIYATEPNTNVYFGYTEGSDTTKDVGFIPGSIHQFIFYASPASKCPGTQLMSKAVRIPYYNPYSEYAICKGHEDYALCQKYSNIYLAIDNDADFYSRMNAYLKSLNDKPNDNPPVVVPQEKTIWDSIFDFAEAYYLYILGPIIVIGIILIIVIQVRKKRGDIL